MQRVQAKSSLSGSMQLGVNGKCSAGGLVGLASYSESRSLFSASACGSTRTSALSCTIWAGWVAFSVLCSAYLEYYLYTRVSPVVYYFLRCDHNHICLTPSVSMRTGYIICCSRNLCVFRKACALLDNSIQHGFWNHLFHALHSARCVSPLRSSSRLARPTAISMVQLSLV